MAEEQRGNRGGNSYGHGSSRSGGGYRGNDGSHGGFHKGGHRGYRGRDDDRRGGYRGNDGHRDFHKDDRRNGERSGGYRGRNDGDYRDGGRGGYSHDGDRKDFHRHDERRDGYRSSGYRGRDDRRGGYRGNGGHRDFHRDGEHSGYRGGDDRRNFGRDGERRDDGRREFNKGGFRRNDDKRGGYRGGDDRRNFHRHDDRRGGYRSGGYQGRDDDRRGGYQNRDRRDGDRHDFHRNDERRNGFNAQNSDRRSSRRDEEHGGYNSYNNHRQDRNDNRRGNSRNDGRDRYMHEGPRRNSDGTVSFPSQNPYTDRRPGEPKMPKGMEWSMLSKDEKERLRGLSKEHAENIGLHILAAYALEESDPEAAREHAEWVAHQASRIDFSRETLAFVAYRQGDYKTALKEFRTAHRMNGFNDYLPFIADCERGLGNPKRAIEMAMSDNAKMLSGESKAEMFLVYAGALGDLGLWDKAVDVVDKLANTNGLPGAYRMRALQAEQYFLEESGRGEEAVDLDSIIEQLENKYADMDEEDAEDVVIDYDLERLPDDMMEELGITDEDAQYAPVDPYEDDERPKRYQTSDEGVSTEASDEDTQQDDELQSESVSEDVTAQAAAAADVEENADQVEVINDFGDPYESQESMDERLAAGKPEASPMLQTEGDADGNENDLPAQESIDGVDSVEDPAVEQAEGDESYESGERE
jgi:tetratricopeptide (TPR) repeat protein